MLKIQRKTNGKVIFTLSGRIDAEDVDELRKLLELEGASSHIALDLKDVTLVDRDAIKFLTDCEASSIKLEHCPPYVRERWRSGLLHLSCLGRTPRTAFGPGKECYLKAYCSHPIRRCRRRSAPNVRHHIHAPTIKMQSIGFGMFGRRVRAVETHDRMILIFDLDSAQEMVTPFFFKRRQHWSKINI
jgi:hypothetical protein